MKQSTLDNRIAAMAKMANLTAILEAAQTLDAHGVLLDAPHTYVARYIDQHPEIKGLIEGNL